MRDKSDALGIAEKQADQLRHIFPLEDLSFDIENIVFSGMGGSALAARLSLSWPSYTLPFEISSNYEIPAYVSSKTLFIASSYSGNTEETLAALTAAEDKNAHIVVISSGGKLKDIAHEKGHAYIELPKVTQPRYATLYSYKALVTVLEKAGLVHASEAEKSIEQAASFLEQEISAWLPTVSKQHNQAKKLAFDLIGTSPVIYGGPKMFPLAYKWKISINENAKNVAWCNQFPEFNHNEFLGWSSHPVQKPYRIILLESSFEHERIQKRFRISTKMLSGRWPEPIVVASKGETLLQQMLWSLALGDFTSIYMALLNGLDPTPVELIEKFKKQLVD